MATKKTVKKANRKFLITANRLRAVKACSAAREWFEMNFERDKDRGVPTIQVLRAAITRDENWVYWWVLYGGQIKKSEAYKAAGAVLALIERSAKKIVKVTEKRLILELIELFKARNYKAIQKRVDGLDSWDYGSVWILFESISRLSLVMSKKIRCMDNLMQAAGDLNNDYKTRTGHYKPFVDLEESYLAIAEAFFG